MRSSIEEPKTPKTFVPFYLQRSPQSATLNLCCEVELWFGFSIFVTSQQRVQHDTMLGNVFCNNFEVRSTKICMGSFSYRLRIQFWRSNVWFLALRLCHTTRPSLEW